MADSKVIKPHVDEYAFLKENFVSGCSLWRIETSRLDVAATLEEEYEQAVVLYTGKTTWHQEDTTVLTYLAVIPEESLVRKVLRAYGWKREIEEIIRGDELHGLFLYQDMPTQTFWEHAVRQL